MVTEECFGGSFNISGAHDKIDGGDMEKRGGGQFAYRWNPPVTAYYVSKVINLEPSGGLGVGGLCTLFKKQFAIKVGWGELSFL